MTLTTGVENAKPERIEDKTTSPEMREQAIRTWIARKESVCPYAPGLAKFVYLPDIAGNSMENVKYIANELLEFYRAKEKGKRVGRWMLLPEKEWQCHDEAHRYSEHLFWLLNAAYYYLRKDRKGVKAALNREITGYDRGYKGEILNPVIGKLPNRCAKTVPAKTLFYSALSPLYRSKQFYRYSPYCLVPLVYADEFQMLKQKHPQVTETVCFEMAYTGLYEHYGEDLKLDLKLFRQELPIWGSIVDRIAEIMRSRLLGLPVDSPDVKGSPESNLTYFRESPLKLASAFFTKYRDHLVILREIMAMTGATPKHVIGASFAGSGLYTIPDY